MLKKADKAEGQPNFARLPSRPGTVNVEQRTVTLSHIPAGVPPALRVDRVAAYPAVQLPIELACLQRARLHELKPLKPCLNAKQFRSRCPARCCGIKLRVEPAINLAAFIELRWLLNFRSLADTFLQAANAIEKSANVGIE